MFCIEENLYLRELCKEDAQDIFNAIDGIVSPTSICAVAILVIKKNAKIILLILDYLIVSTVFPQVNIIEP